MGTPDRTALLSRDLWSVALARRYVTCSVTTQISDTKDEWPPRTRLGG